MLSTFLIEFGLILLLIFANGVFSMAEMAVVSSRKVRLQQRAEEGSETARAALDLAENPNQFLSTVQVGITLISTLTGALGGARLSQPVANWLRGIPQVAEYADAIAIVLIVALVSFFSLVLGELVPKRIALSNPEKISAGVARPMKLFAAIGRPMVWVLSISTDGIIRLLGIKQPDDPPITPEEITVMMEQGEMTGVFEEAETEMVEAIFRLGDLHAGSLMTPRTDLDWIDLEDPYDISLQVVLDSQHNYFPVGDGGLDEVIGILHGRDLLARIRSNGDGAIELRELAMPAQFVPESMPAFNVLERLKEASGNLAMVIDEYGGVIGMVTLFDVMEAMVGGISIGGVPVVPEAVQREDGSWLIEGMMRIDEFKKILDLDELPDEDRAGYQTVGGFVMAQIGSVPGAGEAFECCGWRFEVMDMDNLRVDKVLATKTEGE